MKKILSILVLLFSIVGLSARDLTKEQKELRLDLVKYLIKDSIDAKVDRDGDIKFKHNDKWHYIIINEDWENPFLATLFVNFPYVGKDHTRENMENFITVVSQYKIVKLYCRDSTYEYRSDVICKNADILKKSFNLMLNEIDAARANVNIMLSAGLTEAGIVNDKNAVWEKAVSYYKNGEYNISFPLFRYLANSGYSKAYYYIGLSYENGNGVEKDDALMKKYYEKAIESGFISCAYVLGEYYYNNKDYEKALDYFIKCGSSDNGLRSDALYLAGKMNENGEGCERSIIRAISYYKKSVQYATELECDARLALMRLDEPIERESDFVEATESMLMGMTPAQMYNRGQEYEYGPDNNVSLTKAYAYYKAAADKGYAKAERKMGEIYISKFYPFNDKKKSDKYYSKAIRSYKKKVESDGDACLELGDMYLNGLGTEKDKDQAIYYFKLGISLGDINAAWRMGLICKDELEYEKAFNYFFNAAEGGQGMAMLELAKLYENGIGTSMNKDKAIEWYKKCSESDYKAKEEALKALERLEYNEDKI